MPPSEVHGFVRSIIGDDLHAAQVLSLSNGVVGVIHSSTMGIAAIGAGLAAAKGLTSKHATKQVDRVLSNRKIHGRRTLQTLGEPSGGGAPGNFRRTGLDGVCKGRPQHHRRLSADQLRAGDAADVEDPWSVHPEGTQKRL